MPRAVGGPPPPRGRCRMEKRAESASGFRKETVNKILHLHFKDDKTRVSSDALLLMAEMLNVFVREAAARGARQAQAEDLDRVDIEHVEKVLPQLIFWIFRGLIKQKGMHQLLRGESPDLGVNLILNVWTGILFSYGDGHCCCFTMPLPSCCSNCCFLTPLI
ncbi:unnamed protein product [Eretmochelys imbricata]